MRIAVIGLGFMGATHIKALAGIPGAELAAVVSSDERKLAGDLSSIQGNLGGSGGLLDFSSLARYRTVDECFRDRSIDAVDLCIPTDLHAPLAIAALQAGKHVLVEKPLALDGETADRMIQVAQQSGRILMCAQVLRFFPEYRKAAELLPSLGAPRLSLFRRRCGAPSWNRWLGDADRSGGGVFDLLIHDVDYSVKLFGTPESVSATGFTDPERGIDWISAEFRYRHSGAVVIEGGWYAPASYPFSMGFSLMADAGTLDYSSAGQPLRLLPAQGEERLVELDQTDGFSAELAYFIDCASTGRQPTLCPVADSALSVRLTRAMLESRKQGARKLLSPPALHP